MKPFGGVEEILKYADKNVIMTHKHRAGVMEILEYYGWDKYFVDMVTIDDGFPENRTLYLMIICIKAQY